MSQLPIMSLDEAIPTTAAPMDAYMQTMDMIQQSLELTGMRKPDTPTLPSYYDDMLRQLIDSIPLE